MTTPSEKREGPPPTRNVPSDGRLAGKDDPEGRTAIEWERLRFDRQKSAIEFRLKRQELADRPIKGWKEVLGNPLTLAIVGGFITLMTTIVSNHFTTKANLATEATRAELAARTENIKAELAAKAAKQTLQADLIKKFVESPKTETVRENLRFLVDAGLLPDYGEKIEAYLTENPDSAPQVGGEPQTKPVEYVGRAFNVVGFRAYATQLRFATWKPELIVLHSTVSPNLAQSSGVTTSTPALARGGALPTCWVRRTVRVLRVTRPHDLANAAIAASRSAGIRGSACDPRGGRRRAQTPASCEASGGYPQSNRVG
jgi:hypothetical protein